MYPKKNVRFIAINDVVDSAYRDNEFTPFRDTSKKIRAVFRQRDRLESIYPPIRLTDTGRTP
jgi:hypothetical protein